MSALEWKETIGSPQSTPPMHTTADQGPWFGIAMGLLGIIIGYLIGVYI